MRPRLKRRVRLPQLGKRTGDVPKAGAAVPLAIPANPQAAFRAAQPLPQTVVVLLQAAALCASTSRLSYSPRLVPLPTAYPLTSAGDARMSIRPKSLRATSAEDQVRGNSSSRIVMTPTH